MLQLYGRNAETQKTDSEVIIAKSNMKELADGEGSCVIKQSVSLITCYFIQNCFKYNFLTYILYFFSILDWSRFRLVDKAINRVRNC